VGLRSHFLVGIAAALGLALVLAAATGLFFAGHRGLAFRGALQGIPLGVGVLLGVAILLTLLL
jgi:hypothetical protein